MFRVIKKLDLVTHTCVQCGCTTSYYTSHGPTYCRVCKASQRLRSKNRKVDLPAYFVMEYQEWRVWYQVSETNCNFIPEKYKDG